MREENCSERGPIGVAGVQFMQKCSMNGANCQQLLLSAYHSNEFVAGSWRFEGR